VPGARAPGKRCGDGRRAERLLLELLRPEGPRGCAEATADDVREAAALAFGHGLFLQVDRSIREHAGSFPAGLVAGGYETAMRLLRLEHISHALRYERVEREVLALLDAAAVPSVILKGSALSRDLYGDPHSRTSADIDLLVRPGDVPAADTALREAGYRRDNDRPLNFWMRRLHHAVYQRPGSRVPVEIHWNFSIPGFFNLAPEEIWDGVDLDGLRGLLNPVMNLTLLLMHHHLHGCADLRTLVDLVWAFDRHRGELDPGRWTEHLETTGLLVVSGIVRLQAEALWGPQLRDRGWCGESDGLRVRLLAGASVSALRPGRQPRAGDRYLHALIHRLGLDAPQRVIWSIAKTLLPSAADVRALNGGERRGLPGYVRYFLWRLGGRFSGDQEKGRPRA
jgi:hypothetical protein